MLAMPPAIDLPVSSASSPAAGPIAAGDYRTLADFRRYLRCFLAFSETITEGAGMHPGQYQALLAIRALTSDGLVTTSALADQLCLKLNTVVELVNRLVMAGWVERSRAAHDRRSTALSLTAAGERALAPLAAAHLDHHRAHLPALIDSMAALAG